MVVIFQKCDVMIAYSAMEVLQHLMHTESAATKLSQIKAQPDPSYIVGGVRDIQQQHRVDFFNHMIDGLLNIAVLLLLQNFLWAECEVSVHAEMTDTAMCFLDILICIPYLIDIILDFFVVNINVARVLKSLMVSVVIRQLMSKKH